MPLLTVLFLREGESWSALARRIVETPGEEIILVLSAAESAPLLEEGNRRLFFTECAAARDRLLIAVRQKTIAAAARGEGFRVIDWTRTLRKLLAGHESLDEALRLFSPHVWRQELRSRLQVMGLLSLPKIRIGVLSSLSIVLFLFVLFRLLPSAEIRVWPHEETLSQTANVFLALSGAIIDIPQRVRTMPLIPITVTLNRSMTFDQISKEFIGTSAEVAMTIINRSTERYSLRSGTRLMNQAGMIFRIQEPLNIDPGQEMTIRAKADDLDLYGEIIGERGNVRAGLKWEFPGLAPEERKLVDGENRVEARGGTTAYRSVLQQSDLEIARKRLELELLTNAKQLADEELTIRNMEGTQVKLEMLYYEELTKVRYEKFVLSTQFLGEPVSSVPIEGSITYKSYAYDASALLTMLREELLSHVGEGERLLSESIGFDRMVVHVIDYADDLSWIKLTVDLSGTSQFILDPLKPTGAQFGKKVREAVAGELLSDAFRIIKNFPEVDTVEIRLWPPWHRTLPTIRSQISIVPQ
jgi:hypothetical protein